MKRERGDFYRIRFLDSEVLHKIKKAEGIADNELILGGIYSAILEKRVEDASGEYCYWDFVVLGEHGPIDQLRISIQDLESEKVFIKRVDTGVSGFRLPWSMYGKADNKYAISILEHHRERLIDTETELNLRVQAMEPCDVIEGGRLCKQIEGNTNLINQLDMAIFALRGDR